MSTGVEAASPDMATTPAAEPLPGMEDLISLCKRRGFIFPSSEIYNGFNGFYDYGPLGVELKQNIKSQWWRTFVHGREDMTGLDSSIIANPAIWEASGHVAGFSDPMVDCKGSKLRFRADQLFYAKVELEGGDGDIGYLCLQESADNEAAFAKAAKKLKKKAKATGTLAPLVIKELIEASPEELALIPSPGSGVVGDLTEPRDFNLMFSTQVGALQGSASSAYLRPETAQGIFVNFKNVREVARAKVPFGIAQVGKAFRNEITPRNFIFRSREFEQMEIEYFIEPGDDVWPVEHEKWIENMKDFLLSLGLREDLMGYEVHAGDKLAHYARACTDITFKFPFGEQELLGVAARGNFDLTQHQEASGKSLEYFDEVAKEKYLPHVIEPSCGVDRLFLALLSSAYAVDEIGGEKRNVLRFHPSVAPIKVAVFPLVKNKPEIVAKARDIFTNLQKRYNVVWDTSGAIGRRYRRMDEAGTPFCVTVDFDSVEDDTVTVRDRDTTEQTRIPISELYQLLSQKIDGF
eukprot:CAMPEP_0185774146 /NCGR_PEP_ID=MMETSP1174-20130828/76888_1 /TAXON_ID=35687 /ORGANISM="Dictyocha speculum, Strain CCMP1381" /LENGTH=519 /DNA_ID=CAMNT_0028461167 /DNA_START=69 /DNA_END=1628 /DNA_ORIENTATION=+